MLRHCPHGTLRLFSLESSNWRYTWLIHLPYIYRTYKTRWKRFTVRVLHLLCVGQYSNSFRGTTQKLAHLGIGRRQKVRLSVICLGRAVMSKTRHKAGRFSPLLPRVLLLMMTMNLARPHTRLRTHPLRNHRHSYLQMLANQWVKRLTHWHSRRSRTVRYLPTNILHN